MSRTRTALAAIAGLITLTAVVVPTSGAGAATDCVAWGSLPSRVVLGPDGVTVHSTLHASSACAGVTADNGATATLRSPAARDDIQLRWSRIGAGDDATYYPSLDRPGTYRIVDGDLQTYDAEYVHIAATWHETTTVLKYEGHFAGVTRHRASLAATLKFYGSLGWQDHSRVVVSLQRRSSSGWRTVARTRSASGGRVRFAVGSGRYRLVSAATGVVWGTVAYPGASPA